MLDYVELEGFPVLRVRADMKGKGPKAAFDLLESKLPTLKGRRFYGTFRMTPGGEEYFACVARIDSDDVENMQLETGEVKGGTYVRTKMLDWEKKIAELPYQFTELARGRDVDLGRPSLEFYRSRTELQLMVPVLSKREL